MSVCHELYSFSQCYWTPEYANKNVNSRFTNVQCDIWNLLYNLSSLGIRPQSLCPPPSLLFLSFCLFTALVSPSCALQTNLVAVTIDCEVCSLEADCTAAICFARMSIKSTWNNKLLWQYYSTLHLCIYAKVLFLVVLWDISRLS